MEIIQFLDGGVMSSSNDKWGLLTQVVLAMITFLGIVITSIVGNWDKLFGDRSAATPSPTPSVKASVDVTPAPAIATINHGSKESLINSTIYIHISSEKQRNDATALMSKLRDDGASVPRVSNLVVDRVVPPEKVQNYFPKSEIQVRFFYEEDMVKAKRIKSLVNQGAWSDIQLIPLLKLLDKEPPGTLEIWYPASQPQ